MNLSLVLDLAVAANPDREAVTSNGRRLSYADLDRQARAVAAAITAAGLRAVLHLGPSSPALPVLLFGAARAGVPFVPLNYRLGAEQIDALVADHPMSLVVHADRCPQAPSATCVSLGEIDGWAGDPDAAPEAPADEDAIAVLLYTSGTTAAPKPAILRHRHLMSYLFGTVEFGAAGEDDAALVAVPPYHVAGVTNLVSNAYAGRRIVYLDGFDAATWLDTVRSERITQAMVVPTMLARIVDELGDAAADAPSLRSIAYGGARMPLPVLERALRAFPPVGFVNAYGLTETSSTIAVLGPDEHREAIAATDPDVRARLGSVGRLVPGVELEVRGEDGSVVEPGTPGLLFLRGDQVSGEYVGSSSAVDADGWFATRDRGWVDAAGYLFIEGRADDTIIRGGENIAPAEIEDVLVAHPMVREAVVVGLPDDEWGQRVAAVVVPTDGADVDGEVLREWVRGRLRSSKTPDVVRFRPSLPRTDTGKLLRREILADLLTGGDVAAARW